MSAKDDNQRKKMSRRDFLKVSGLGASALAASSILAACAPAATATQAPAPATQAPAPATAAPAATATAAPVATAAPTAAELSGNLTVWSWADNPNLRDTAALFTAKYPKVSFTFNTMSWQDTHQKLAVALAAGSGAPDIVSIDGAEMQNFVDIGGLLDVTKALTPFVNDFPAYKIAEVSDPKGNMFAFPWDAGPLSLFYRKDIFDNHNATPPTTWADYIALGQKWAKEGIYMLPFSLTTPNPQDFALFQKLLWQNGGSYFDKATGAVTLDNAVGLEAIDMYANLIFAGITFEVEPFTPAGYGAWKDGKVVTDMGAAWMGHVFSDNVQKGDGGFGQWRIADQLPAFTAGGSPTGDQGGSNVAATAQTKFPEAATAYCAFTCASVDGQVAMGVKGTFPSFIPALQDPRMIDATLPVYGDQKFNDPFIKLLPLTPTAYWRDKAFPEADTIVNAGLANIATKIWKPEDGLKNIANNIRAALLRA
ncbi:MAG: extracellular solute-binding protein [Anaerolineales bacterium]